MSWEDIKEKCGCSFGDDDWGQTRKTKCAEHILEEQKWREKIDQEEAKNKNRCIDCVRKDNLLRHKYISGYIRSKSICDFQKELNKKNFKNEFNIVNLRSKFGFLDSRDLEDDDLLKNPKFKEEYFKFNPKARGTNTKVFKKWLLNFISKKLSKQHEIK